MGIRSLRRWLFKRTHSKLIELITFKVNNLYIDFIQLAHKAVNEDPKVSEDVIINRTVEILFATIDRFRPSDFLGIFFDGIPPMSKIMNQRERRYKMKASPGEFHRAIITVGTPFMTKLTNKVKEAIDLHKSELPRNIYMSLIDTPGEGEHKLFDHIRVTKPKGNTIAVADDTDVVIMSLYNNLSDMYIWVDYVDKEHPEKKERGLIDINDITSGIIELLLNSPTAVQDFCLLVALSGGNDFLPYIHAMKSRDRTMDTLIGVYNNLKLNLTIQNGFSISWTNLQKFLKKLSFKEEYLLRKLDEQWEQRMSKQQEKVGPGHVLDEQNLIKDVPLYENSRDITNEEIQLGLFRIAWNNEMYRIFDRTEKYTDIIVYPSEKEIQIEHQQMAKDYLYGMYWFLSYMKHGYVTDWYYPFNFPPLIGDLSKFLDTNENPGVPWTENRWTPPDQDIYLLLVIPPWLSEIMPVKLRSIFDLNSNMFDSFPRHFESFTMGEFLKDADRILVFPPDIERFQKWLIENVKGYKINASSEHYDHVLKNQKWIKVKPYKQEFNITDFNFVLDSVKEIYIPEFRQALLIPAF